MSSNHSDTESVSEQIQDVVLDEPMFYILTQFLETKDGKNIATVLDELKTELHALRVMLSSSLASKSSSSVGSSAENGPVSS